MVHGLYEQGDEGRQTLHQSQVRAWVHKYEKKRSYCVRGRKDSR